CLPPWPPACARPTRWPTTNNHTTVRARCQVRWKNQQGPVSSPLTEVPMSLARKLGAEFLGTGILVFIAVGTATETFAFHLFGLSFAAGVAATALAFGLVLIALVYAIGPISGCHINPAVTMGFITSGRMKLTEGVAFMVAQVVGAIGGAYLLYGVMVNIPSYHKQIQGLGADGYGKYSHLLLNQTGAFLVEAVLTFVFVSVVLYATHKAAIQGLAGVAIGMALVVVHLIGIPLTGTSVNPARRVGAALVVGGSALSQLWLFIVAPLVGAIVAALLYRYFFAEEAPAVPSTPSIPTAP